MPSEVMYAEPQDPEILRKVMEAYRDDEAEYGQLDSVMFVPTPDGLIMLCQCGHMDCEHDDECLRVGCDCTSLNTHVGDVYIREKQMYIPNHITLLRPRVAPGWVRATGPLKRRSRNG